MNEPIRLEHDDTTNQWTLTVKDGKGGERSVVLPGNIVDALAQRVITQRAVAAAIRSGVQAQVTAVVNANMGDHGEFIRKPLTYDPQETVISLLARAHDLASPYHHMNEGDRVELQVIPETVPPLSHVPGMSAALDF
jgi:hypothetical protein